MEALDEGSPVVSVGRNLPYRKSVALSVPGDFPHFAEDRRELQTFVARARVDRSPEPSSSTGFDATRPRVVPEVAAPGDSPDHQAEEEARAREPTKSAPEGEAAPVLDIGGDAPSDRYIRGQHDAPGEPRSVQAHGPPIRGVGSGGEGRVHGRGFLYSSMSGVDRTDPGVSAGVVASRGVWWRRWSYKRLSGNCALSHRYLSAAPRILANVNAKNFPILPRGGEQHSLVAVLVLL